MVLILDGNSRIKEHIRFVTFIRTNQKPYTGQITEIYEVPSYISTMVRTETLFDLILELTIQN